jgi:hypothetical protein
MSAGGEELLQRLLEQGPERAARAADLDPAAQAELRELARFVALCRRELAEPADARLVAAILARTTRQDPGWRGDLALVGLFVRDALAASTLARVAAALLLLPLLGAPLMAWMFWRAAVERGAFSARVEIEEVEPFLPAAPESPQGGIEFPWLGDPFRDLAQPPAKVVVTRPGETRAAASRAASASALRRADWPRLETLEGGLADVLTRRAGLWSGADSRAAAGAIAHGDEALARALEVELLLDRWARDGSPPAELDAALAGLGRDPAAALDVRRVEALALERARAYGRVDADAWARLTLSGARPGERAADDPLDLHWRANLAAALEHSPAGRALLGRSDVAEWLERR